MKTLSEVYNFVKSLISDKDGDTKIQVEKNPDEDIIRTDVAGQEVQTIGSTVTTINPNQYDHSLAVHSEDTQNVLYVKGTSGQDGVSMGTDTTTFTVSGATKRSRFLSLKPDAINYNCSAIACSSDDALRASDFSVLRSRGSFGSETANVSGDWLHQYFVHGHDGSNYVFAGGFRYEVADTITAGVVPLLVKFQTMDSAGDLSTRLTIDRENILIGTTGSPNSGLDIQVSVAYKVTNLAGTTTKYTTDNDIVIGANSFSRSQEIELSTADTVNGRVIEVKDRIGNASTYPITVSTQGSAKIDGRDTFIINEDYGAVQLYCGGSNWFIRNRTLDPAKMRIEVVNTATKTLIPAMWNVMVAYTATGAVTLTLPSASVAYDSTNKKGHSFIIKDIGVNAAVNNITINRAGTDTIIDAAVGTSTTINTNGGFKQIVAISSTQWAVINN